MVPKKKHPSENHVLYVLHDQSDAIGRNDRKKQLHHIGRWKVRRRSSHVSELERPEWLVPRCPEWGLFGGGMMLDKADGRCADIHACIQQGP